MDWPKLSTAHHPHDLAEDFEVTHPFHPLRGRRFQLLSYRNNWGEDRVTFEDQEGRVCALPASWTSVVAPDPFVALSAGRSFFRIEELMRLVALMREREGGCKDDFADDVKTNKPLTVNCNTMKR